MSFRNCLMLALVVVVGMIGSGASQCNTGPVQCCNSVDSASSSLVSQLLAIFGVPVSSVTGLVGVTCLSITGIGASGNGCAQQPVCCTNNNFNGVIALGCTPINING
jgi:hypothetical protein